MDRRKEKEIMDKGRRWKRENELMEEKKDDRMQRGKRKKGKKDDGMGKGKWKEERMEKGKRKMIAP